MTVEPQELFLNINGFEVECLRWPGRGPALVMLHATGFLPWIWHPIARELGPFTWWGILWERR